ncbi:MAG: hypothetical protein AAF702_51075 [Chloroflexota bacterium]
MKRRKRSKQFIYACLLITLIFAGSTLYIANGASDTNTPGVLSLAPPVFAQDSDVESAALSGIGSKLDSEAGISAYFQASGPIDLNVVRGLYATREIETDDYIVGEIPGTIYTAEWERPHVYIHKDGWVLAYFNKDEPTSKMIDLATYASSGSITTKLRDVLDTVAPYTNTSLTDDNVVYYHFQYPNAEKMLVVSEISGQDGNSFRIVLPPAGHEFFELSAVVRANSTHDALQIDGATIIDVGSNGCWDCSTIINQAQLSIGQPHTVRLYDYYTSGDYAALIILYREVQ